MTIRSLWLSADGMGPQSGNAKRLRDFCIAWRRLRWSDSCGSSELRRSAENLSRSLIMERLIRASGR
ncbi:hypothetical protein [Methanosarcina mazei]|uniref:hypothetical protein n=1 Tax=Methanosarcina mazei TaxID=2209 RepID=UPI0012D4BCB6|nr:hypothetical protein [Methanosarcina mazei]